MWVLGFSHHRVFDYYYNSFRSPKCVTTFTIFTIWSFRSFFVLPSFVFCGLSHVMFFLFLFPSSSFFALRRLLFSFLFSLFLLRSSFNLQMFCVPVSYHRHRANRRVILFFDLHFVLISLSAPVIFQIWIARRFCACNVQCGMSVLKSRVSLYLHCTILINIDNFPGRTPVRRAVHRPSCVFVRIALLTRRRRRMALCESLES